MPASRFEFDENGDTFLCFFVAFYTIVLIPVTYFFWPTFDSRDNSEQGKRKCLCSPCQVKRLQLKRSTSVKKLKKIVVNCVFFVAWVVFFLLVYRLTLIDTAEVGFDPFAVLEIDSGASLVEIRKAYKRLSLKHHPDRQGDEKQFILVSKAYAALTHEISRKNWEEYGNPDGPRAAHFGIALPKWMVEKDNSYLVIGAYFILFMLVLPIAVGTWWYNTMRFTNNRILIDTVRDFCYAFVRSPFMAMPRVIKVLSNAHEFDPSHNKEVTCRPSDNLEVPPLILQIPQFTIFKKAIVGSPSSIKARALIYAHLERLDLPQNTLHLDRQYIIKHSPRLVEEMINSLLYILAYAMEEADGRYKTSQHLATMENCMHVVPMLIQAVSDPGTSLLQLPHIGSTQLRHMSAKQRNIKSVRQLIRLPDDKRRNLLRGLSDENYRDILTVCANMPSLEIRCHCGISGEEDQTIWSLTMVTVTVHLKRLPLLDLPTGNTSNSSPTAPSAGVTAAAGSGGGASAGAGGVATGSADRQTAPQHYSEAGWNRSVASQRRQDRQQHGAELYPAIDSQGPVGAGESLYSVGAASPIDCVDGESEGLPGQPTSTSTSPTNGPVRKQTSLVWDRKKKKNPRRGGKQQRKQQQQQNRNQVSSPSADRKSKTPASGVLDMSDDEDEQIAFENHVGGYDNGSGEAGPDCSAQDLLSGDQDDDLDNEKEEGDDQRVKCSSKVDPKATNLFAKKPGSAGDSNLPHCTHLVHCPYFPVEKFEGWWLYIVDRRTKQLITRPYYLATLQTEEVVPLRFVAPAKPGTYMYSLCVRSDSYVDSDFSETIRFTVKPIPEGVIRLLEKHEDHEEDEDDEEEEHADDGEVEEIEEDEDEELEEDDECELVEPEEPGLEELSEGSSSA